MTQLSTPLSTFGSFLEEEGIREEVEAVAILSQRKFSRPPCGDSVCLLQLSRG
jgi:hypothetical protein